MTGETVVDTDTVEEGVWEVEDMTGVIVAEVTGLVGEVVVDILAVVGEEVMIWEIIYHHSSIIHPAEVPMATLLATGIIKHNEFQRNWGFLLSDLLVIENMLLVHNLGVWRQNNLFIRHYHYETPNSQNF